MTRYWGRSLSSGNQGQYPLIEAELNRLGVIFESRDRVLSSGGIQRRYRFAESELGKLPDDEGPYLPVSEEQGFSIWEMTDKEWSGE